MALSIEPILHTFYNNNDAFGMTGPFVAISKDALAYEVNDMLEDFARESGRPVADVRAEFIAGLEEVRFYTASCEHEFLAFEASSMDEAVERISDTWGYARPEPFDVTITEHLTAEARDRRHEASAATHAVRTITVVSGDGLEEVRYYRASDGCVSEDYEAASMDEAIEKARASWEGAGEGTYEVTVCEHLTKEERDEMYRAGATRPTATETITVVAK